MKNIRHLAELNYKKAAALFLQLDNPIDILKVQLDQAVLIEDHLQGTGGKLVCIFHVCHYAPKFGLCH